MVTPFSPSLSSTWSFSNSDLTATYNNTATWYGAMTTQQNAIKVKMDTVSNGKTIIGMSAVQDMSSISGNDVYNAFLYNAPTSLCGYAWESNASTFSAKVCHNDSSPTVVTASDGDTFEVTYASDGTVVFKHNGSAVRTYSGVSGITSFYGGIAGYSGTAVATLQDSGSTPSSGGTRLPPPPIVLGGY